MNMAYHADFHPAKFTKPVFSRASTRKHSKEKTRKPQILLVEDNPLIQKAELFLFKKINCVVTVAGTGQEALDAFHCHYDIIFLDIDLPDMSGIEVATSLRHQKLGAHKIPIIALTAHESDITLACRAAGINEVLPKPLTLQSLEAVLRRHIPHFSSLFSSF